MSEGHGEWPAVAYNSCILAFSLEAAVAPCGILRYLADLAMHITVCVAHPPSVTRRLACSVSRHVTVHARVQEGGDREGAHQHGDGYERAGEGARGRGEGTMASHAVVEQGRACMHGISP